MKKMMKRIKNTVPAPPFRKHNRPTAGLILVLIMLMACGGGGGGGGSFGELVAGGGIGGTGISIGTISGFGSVIVNDEHFDTEDAEVIINGEPIDTQNLEIDSVLAKGMVVRVEASYTKDGRALADQIVFTSNLRGTVLNITDIDSESRVLSILNQTVILNNQTQSNDTGLDFEDIEVDDVLEVSGWIGVGGQIRASYVRKVSDPSVEQMIKGKVTDRDEDDGQWFRINQLKIDMSKIHDPMPAVDQLVIVHGIFIQSDSGEDNILKAGEIQIEDELGVRDSDSVEIEGIVSRALLTGVFILGSTTVQTDAATEYVGLIPGDIIPGARLFVEGALSDGVLLADEVTAIELADEIDTIDKIDIEGHIATVQQDPGKITLIGLSPLVVHVNSATKIFGDASELSEIDRGKHVKILGYAVDLEYVSSGQIKVNKNERPKVKLQGPINDINIDEQIISVFGVEIDVKQIAASGDDKVIPVDIFDRANIGDTVNVMGNLVGDSVVWKEIELLTLEN